MTPRPASNKYRNKLKNYIIELREKSKTTTIPRITTEQMAKELGIPRSTLYKYHKKEIIEFREIINSTTISSNKKLLQAARRENKILRERNAILTSIAHEYFIENEKLKENIISLKSQKIVRIK